MPVASNACVIDTSAIVAMLFGEPEGEACAVRLGSSPYRILPPSCVVEFCMLRRLGRDLRTWIGDFIDEYEIAVMPMNADIGWLAADAAVRYGRGSRHPASLNFGDCMSYAFARYFDAPLLFKGNDFIHTDLTPALA
jgi:ribonuclease VapC